MMLSSIRARMTLGFALAIALLLALVCSGTWWYARAAAERRARVLLSDAASETQDELSGEEAGGNIVAALRAERQLLRPRGLSLFLLDKQGRQLGADAESPGAPPSTNSPDWQVLRVPVKSGTAVIALPWQSTARTLRSQAEELVSLGACVTVAAAVGAWILIGRTLSPIGALARQAKSASTADLSVRLTAPSNDAEIVGLVETLNGLLSHLAETAAARSRIYAAVSHELRTPLQALSGHLELALQRDRTAGEYKQVVEEAHKQTKRLVALARDLLMLRQLEAAQPPPCELVSLPAACARALAAVEPLTQQRRLDVRACMSEDAVVHAAPTHIDMLARNLIENAVKYTQEAGVVRVVAAPTAGGARLEVFNTYHFNGEPPPMRWLEAFYRTDVSRNAKTGGSGLGLAICKAVADANCWELALDQVSDGVRATVEITDSETRIAPS